MAWFSRVRSPKPETGESERLQFPGGLWTKCVGCSAIVYSQELERNLKVCPKCNHHFRLSTEERIALLTDSGSFEELDKDLRSTDPLNFRDQMRYKERIKKAEKKANSIEAVRVGRCRINGTPAFLGCFDFFFMGGSMGIVVGDKLAHMVELATKEERPAIIISASGGARMQEGIFSLMQMAKVTAALVRHGDAGLPYVSILTDPTTGGVAASFAMQGDLNIAEPGALIGFAGPRVIEQTIHRKLPEGFQRSEFLLEHGMIDMIVSRHQMKTTLAKMLTIIMTARGRLH